MNYKSTTLATLFATTCIASAADVIAWNFSEQYFLKEVQGDGVVFGTDQWTDSVSSATQGTTAANSTDPDTVTTPFNAAGVSVAWSSPNVYQAGDENNVLENQVFRMYLDDGGAGSTITVSGLASWLFSENASAYKVTFYQNSDAANNNFAQMNLYDGTGTAGTLLEAMAPQLTDGSGSGSGSRLIRTSTNEFSADTITFHTAANLGGGSRAGVSGFSIQAIPVPEPSSTALLGLGGLALILRRRK